MARHKDDLLNNVMIFGLGGLAIYLIYNQAQAIAGPNMPGIPYYSGTATPLSIYPEFSYTAQTSMSTTPNQKATTAVIPPQSFFTSVQQQEQAALLTQCAGSYPGCTPLLGDTQLGF